MVKSTPDAREGAPLPLPRTAERKMSTDHHDHREESNLKEGVIGVVIAVVGLAIIMTIAHFMAL